MAPTFPIMHLVCVLPLSDEEESAAVRGGGRSLLLGCDVTVPHAGADAGGGATAESGDTCGTGGPGR